MTSTRSFEDATKSNSDKCQAQINVAIRRQSSSYLGLLVIGCRGTPSIMQVCASVPLVCIMILAYSVQAA